MSNRTITIALAALAFAGWVIYSLISFEPVKVTASHLNRSASQLWVSGDLLNSDNTPADITLEIRYFSAAGARTGIDRLQLSKVGAGEKRAFISSPRAADGIDAYTIAIDHGKNAYGN